MYVAIGGKVEFPPTGLIAVPDGVIGVPDGAKAEAVELLRREGSGVLLIG